ncbi:biliverdin-producing heme oxygenase [Novosphingobium sp. M1R2S20]|uniref:Biliverdin-producing heme oxygenase n=1 Tax=Novosphingobium rhizovicinum TaxID=3228928 RepID=A0ABV3RIB8_9SPHN
MQSLLSHFRTATKASHELLDSAFGSLDLSDRADYVRFLSGHYMGMAPVIGQFRNFVEGTLGLQYPDYSRMLREDLAALEVDADSLPGVTPSGEVSPEAAGYVVSGSRLGLTTLARAGYWGRSHDLPSAYMDDVEGLSIWKSTAALLKEDMPDDARAKRQSMAAVVVFDTFREAFATSAPDPVR